MNWVFMFKILSVIYFFSFFISMLFYLGWMQWVVIQLGWMLQVKIELPNLQKIFSILVSKQQ